LFLFEKNKISKPSEKFHFFDKNGLNFNDNKIPEFAKIYFRTKRHLHNFGQNMINPAIVQPSQQIKKTRKIRPPTSLQFHDSRPLPHPTYLLFMCSKKEIEI